jgi:hypothetical protein
MTRQQIIALQERVGTVADGFWGPKSVAACQRHLRAMMPTPNPWPATDQRSLTAFYGAPGDVSRLVNAPVAGLGIRYGGKPVKTIYCHERVSDSLRRALLAISTGPAAWILGQYAGAYNNRPMRGGSLPSLHARGAAVDFAAATNGLHSHWPTRSNMPIEAMEAFAVEGWLGLGWAIGRDAMHFQATR